MPARLCPCLSDISVYSGVCVDIKHSQFLYFAASVTILIIFKGKTHIKVCVILKPIATDAEGPFSVTVSH